MSTIIEKELKILEIDPVEVQERLRAFGATHTFTGLVHDVYYDTPRRKLKSVNKCIRIRKKGGKDILTLKKNLLTKNTKTAYETEITVDDPKQIAQLLVAYGLAPVREKNKHRITYTYGNVTFDIDLYGSIPPLLEIEGPDKRTISQWVRKLGLQKKTTATFGAQGLYKYYKLSPQAMSVASKK